MDMALSLNWIFLGALRVFFYYKDNDASYHIDEEQIDNENADYNTSFAQDTYRMYSSVTLYALFSR